MSRGTLEWRVGRAAHRGVVSFGFLLLAAGPAGAQGSGGGRVPLAEPRDADGAEVASAAADIPEDDVPEKEGSGESPEAASPCGGPCEGDRSCAHEAARCHRERGAPREALSVLKKALQAHPDDGALVRHLALAYLEADNEMWALRKLMTHLESAPGDLESRTWAVWLLAQQGDTRRARQVLEAAPQVSPGPLAQRVKLLEAALLDLEGEPERASDALEVVLERSMPLHPQDATLLSHLRRRIRGDDGRPLSARVLASGGYTTNAVQGTPEEAGVEAGDETASPLFELDALGRWEPWLHPRLRPWSSARVRLLAPTASHAWVHGYLNASGQVGGEWGAADGTRLRLSYSGTHLLLPDRWFMEAHRGELLLNLSPRVQIFGGGGRRIYKRLSRTRWEADGGLGVFQPLGGGWSLTGIAIGRWYEARNPGWSGYGASALARIVAPLPRDGMVKSRAVLGWDRYPRSAESYYPVSDPREDLQLRLELGPWTGGRKGVRLGLTYTFNRRWSSLSQQLALEDSEDDPAYTDHRLLVQVRWSGGADPRVPPEAPVPEDSPIWSYGLGADGDSGLDRIEDLLQQEDSARRGSSCVD